MGAGYRLPSGTLSLHTPTGCSRPPTVTAATMWNRAMGERWKRFSERWLFAAIVAGLLAALVIVALMGWL
jgi:hypothetical protein